MLKTTGFSVGLLACWLFSSSNHMVLASIIKSRLACPDYFINLGGRCYYFSEFTVKSRDLAAKQCKQLDPQAILVNIESIREWQTIKIYLNENGLNSLDWWTGGTDQLEEGQWIWKGTNEPVLYANWCRSEPTGGTSKNCIFLDGQPLSGEKLCWGALPCTNVPNLYVTYFICEIESTSC